MRQSRRASLVESVANVAIGYGIAVASLEVIFPLVGASAVSLGHELAVAGYFSVVSVARSFLVRRFFTARRVAAGT